MAVYIVYRSFDQGPTGKYLKRFEDDTVLDWFCRHWDHLAIEDRELADERLAKVLGCDGWFMWNPFWYAAEQEIPKPATSAALLALLRDHLEDDTFKGTAHALQVLTEEDGEGGALYYLDDHFVKRSRGRAAYLLLEDWRLPGGHGAGSFLSPVRTLELPRGGTGPGTTFVVNLERESKYPLDMDLLGAYRIEGVRLPELAQYLCRVPPATPEFRWHMRFRQLPALMLAGVELGDPTDEAFLRAIRDEPGAVVHWSAWSDWRQEQDREPPGIRLLRGALERLARLPGRLQDEHSRDSDVGAACRELIELEQRHRDELRTTTHSLIHVEEHLAQICLDGSWTDEPYFGQWLFFDDLWASAHPDLAGAILRFALRWDVLSPD
jgi:hypothetical protein